MGRSRGSTEWLTIAHGNVSAKRSELREEFNGRGAQQLRIWRAACRCNGGRNVEVCKAIADIVVVDGDDLAPLCDRQGTGEIKPECESFCEKGFQVVPEAPHLGYRSPASEQESLERSLDGATGEKVSNRRGSSSFRRKTGARVEEFLCAQRKSQGAYEELPGFSLQAIVCQCRRRVSGWSA